MTQKKSKAAPVVEDQGTVAVKPNAVKLGKKANATPEPKVFDDLDTPEPLKTVDIPQKPRTITVAELLGKR